MTETTTQQISPTKYILPVILLVVAVLSLGYAGWSLASFGFSARQFRVYLLPVIAVIWAIQAWPRPAKD